MENTTVENQKNEKLYNSIQEKIEKIYQSENGKKFIKHLALAFLPIDHEKSFEATGSDTCCITGNLKTNKKRLLFKTNASDKQISFPALVALKRFAYKQSLAGDEEFKNMKIKKYVKKETPAETENIVISEPTTQQPQNKNWFQRWFK